MDELEDWKPEIDWSLFQQGAVSNDMWQKFTQLVVLCQKHQHWKESASEYRLAALTPPAEPERGNQRKRRKHRDNVEIDHREETMHEAGYSAFEKIEEMAGLINPDDRGSPDWKLYSALECALPHRQGYEQARFNATAFISFDASEELEGQPEDIAQRWLSAAG